MTLFYKCWNAWRPSNCYSGALMVSNMCLQVARPNHASTNWTPVISNSEVNKQTMKWSILIKSCIWTILWKIYLENKSPPMQPTSTWMLSFLKVENDHKTLAITLQNTFSSPDDDVHCLEEASWGIQDTGGKRGVQATPTRQNRMVVQLQFVHTWVVFDYV